METRDMVVAVDLGGTRFRVAAVDAPGHLYHRSSEPTEPERGRREVISRLFAAVHRLLGQIGRDRVLGVGVAAPGPVDPWTGIIYNPPNLPDWDEVPLKHLFEQEFHLPVLVGNDANLAALGEHHFGAGRRTPYLVYLTISTGIGGGIIDKGQLVLGARGFAGEVGHITIDPHGPVCPCGNRGCLEALASGTSIARIAREAAAAEPGSLLARLVEGQLDRLTAEIVAAAAEQGDATACRIIEQTGVNLGIGVTNLIMLFNPEIVILGGGVMNAGELILAPLRREVELRAMPKLREGVTILRADLGDDAGLLGAAALVLDTLGRS